MARAEIINVNGSKDAGVNISQIVGFNGVNLEEDVMLIQTLFNYIDKIQLSWNLDIKIPGITGKVDDDTLKVITAFQMRHSGRILSFDIRIHPGNYKNRKIDGAGKLMCITLLHLLALEKFLIKGGMGNYIFDLVNLKPELRQHIGLKNPAL
jgi:hypothetical protein